MDQSHHIILTPFNYFESKEQMDILMRIKGLYKVAMETEVDPNATTENIKWHNKIDEAYGILCLCISRDLLLHLNGLTSPNE